MSAGTPMLLNYYAIFDYDNKQFSLAPAARSDTALLKQPLLCGDPTCLINSLACDFDCENLPEGRTWTVQQTAIIVIVLLVLLIFTYMFLTTSRGDDDIEGGNID